MSDFARGAQLVSAWVQTQARLQTRALSVKHVVVSRLKQGDQISCPVQALLSGLPLGVVNADVYGASLEKALSTLSFTSFLALPHVLRLPERMECERISQGPTEET